LSQTFRNYPRFPHWFPQTLHPEKEYLGPRLLNGSIGISISVHVDP
jgi:hypothetical protein